MNQLKLFKKVREMEENMMTKVKTLFKELLEEALKNERGDVERINTKN